MIPSATHTLGLMALLVALAAPTSTSLRADEPAAPSEIPAGATAPAQPLDPATCDETWRTLFETVAAQGPVFSTFTERRWFSVRKEPVVLQGELRHSPERGLCLRYVKPEEQMMIIDTQGILLRNAAGRQRALRTDPRAPQVDTMLLYVLRFDMAALDKLFEIRGARAGDHWRLDFEPRGRELARAVGHLSVEGEATAVRRLEFSRGPKQRVEVEIGETRTGVTFTADELATYFR